MGKIHGTTVYRHNAPSTGHLGKVQLPQQAVETVHRSTVNVNRNMHSFYIMFRECLDVRCDLRRSNLCAPTRWRSSAQNLPFVKLHLTCIWPFQIEKLKIPIFDCHQLLPKCVHLHILWLQNIQLENRQSWVPSTKQIEKLYCFAGLHCLKLVLRGNSEGSKESIESGLHMSISSLFIQYMCTESIATVLYLKIKIVS